MSKSVKSISELERLDEKLNKTLRRISEVGDSFKRPINFLIPILKELSKSLKFKLLMILYESEVSDKSHSKITFHRTLAEPAYSEK